MGDEGGQDDDDELDGNGHLQLVFVALVDADVDTQQYAPADDAHYDVTEAGVGDVGKDVDGGVDQLAHPRPAGQL